MWADLLVVVLVVEKLTTQRLVALVSGLWSQRVALGARNIRWHIFHWYLVNSYGS